MNLYRDDVLVLRTYKLGEADRICVLLGETAGKVRVVAKGVRRTTSKQGSRLEPLAHVRVQCHRGRGELDTLTQAQAIEPFAAIRSDFDRLARASIVVEAVDAMTLDREPAPDVYRLLLGVLRTIDAGDRPLVVAAALLRLLQLDGVAPVVDRCVTCDAEGPLVAIDLEVGGARCERCRSGLAVDDDGFRLLGLILTGRTSAALAEPSSPVTSLLERLAVRAVERHLDRRLRAAAVGDR